MSQEVCWTFFSAHQPNSCVHEFNEHHGFLHLRKNMLLQKKSFWTTNLLSSLTLSSGNIPWSISFALHISPFHTPFYHSIQHQCLQAYIDPCIHTRLHRSPNQSMRGCVYTRKYYIRLYVCLCVVCSFSPTAKLSLCRACLCDTKTVSSNISVQHSIEFCTRIRFEFCFDCRARGLNWFFLISLVLFLALSVCLFVCLNYF